VPVSGILSTLIVHLGALNYDDRMPRFVVLLHQTPPGYPRGTHFDFMLERDKVLLTWALDQLPTTENASLADRLPDHRSLYLDYEGEIAGERGSVSREDRGEFDWIEQSAARYVVQLRGEKLRGLLTLAQDESDAHRWRVSLSG